MTASARLSSFLEQMSPGEKKKPRKIRFVPAENGSVFSIDRPFHALLKDTADPRIKKICLDAPDGLLRSAPDADSLSVSRNPVDRVMYNIIEAAVLLLDEADAHEKEEVFDAIHRALRRLIDTRKHLSSASEPEIRSRLSRLLEDLERLRKVADDETRRLHR